MSLLFHSPVQDGCSVTQTLDDLSQVDRFSSHPAPKSTDMLRLLPAQLGRVENVSLMSSVDFNECVESFLVANVTSWGGIFSPNVRVSFAIRFLRVSEGVGDTGVVGTGVNGEGGSRAEGVGGVSV